MKVEKIVVPKYKLTLSADEIAELWDVLYDAKHKGDQRAATFYDYLEKVRPAGGFEEE